MTSSSRVARRCWPAARGGLASRWPVWRESTCWRRTRQRRRRRRRGGRRAPGHPAVLHRPGRRCVLPVLRRRHPRRAGTERLGPLPRRPDAVTSICARTCCIAPTTTQSSALISPSTTRRPSSCKARVWMLRVWTLFCRVEDVNVLQSLIRLDRPIDDQQGFVRLADRQPDADKHAG